jgi:hypothetical protein
MSTYFGLTIPESHIFKCDKSISKIPILHQNKKKERKFSQQEKTVKANAEIATKSKHFEEFQAGLSSLYTGPFPSITQLKLAD